MNTRKFGYIRVSSKDQNEDCQIEAMKKLITDERDIFVDKQSGRDFNREQYQFLKRMLRKADILYIHSLNRFGRNKEAILQEWKDITQNIQAHIVVLDMPLLDTTQYKDSLGTLITDLVLQILSWLAEEERTKIKTRQREGIEAAKKKGKHLGRPRTEITQEFIEAYNKWKFGQITALDAMRRCNMTSPTFYRVVKRYQERGNKNQ
ncbi:DNA recombinase [Bacillus thuringiensis]|uniref:recombinase family protein n=1 Tax=Bacillus thuringiensis TaxID=1428 RepID=UPI000BED4634|nr:recombinase family protein [Bacillus thuringiensis]PEC17509.1 DNA recombinase [Bacillus thuringiensis]PEV14633.1 DNA recombinase [Bacillus thuringiensis]PEY72825.1 DNA recombinase [Bacillus thuringiensis]PFC45695.1 DNA recombinase [Bacillus thuringiensis]PGV69493.1 DNA recombinase [Bacillus thuringiensis]